MKRALPTFCLLLVFPAVALPSVAGAQMHDEWDESYAGIRTLHRFGIDDAGVRQSYYVALVDLSHPDVRIQVALNRDTWEGAKEPVRAMADRHGAAIAVNGDYWSWGTNDPSQGTTAVDGTCYRAHPERSAIAFDATLSRVEIGRFGSWPIPAAPPDDCPAWVAHAVGAGPQFLYDGVPRWEERPNASDSSVPDINDDTYFGAEAWAWDTGRQPNTAAAISEDGRTLILLTCDGRGAGEAGGCRMASDVTELLLELGAHQAVKLDSGGSTTFYYGGEVLNHVSDGAATAPTERAVVDALLVHSRRVDPGCGVRLDGAPITIDDGSFCFVRTGRYFWAAESGQQGLSRYTWGFEGDRDSYARWVFGVDAPGVYRVEAFVPDLDQLSAQAPYFVTTASGEVRVVGDQAGARGGWLDLGEHELALTDRAEVRLEDNTGDPFYAAGDARNRRVSFDAIRFTPVAAGGPDAGAPPLDGGSDAGGSADAGAMDAGGEPPADPTGCGCRVTARGRRAGALVLVSFALGLARVGRRRARRRGRRALGPETRGDQTLRS